MNLNEIELVPKTKTFYVRYTSNQTGVYKIVGTSEETFKNILVEQHTKMHRAKRYVDEYQTEVNTAQRKMNKLRDDCDFTHYYNQAQDDRSNYEYYLDQQMPKFKKAEKEFNFYFDQINPDAGEYITLMMCYDAEWVFE
ncbi:coil containing protein [Vibrio phage 2.275.O._10N.286.54.E11]|nr:coil containing protein [Vibrio phage 2.275.O._10N.286.54.E11]